MGRYIILLVVFAGLAGIVPHYVERYSVGDHGHAAVTRTAPAAVDLSASAAQPRASYLGDGRHAMLQPNAQGHFTGAFRINGQTVDGLVDTGATYVAMNETTARKLGVNPPESAFVQPVQTANGVTNAARATLGSVEIGQIRADNVDAFVLPDSALSATLIGMSFLKKLQSYEVHDGILDLKN